MTKQFQFVALLVVSLLGALITGSCSSTQPDSGNERVADNDSAIERAFNARTSNVQVEGEGKVERLLADDREGGRHQRFVIRLKSGQTLLVVHNIDIAPRLESLKEGDQVSFNGEYVWNEQGGIIHWTHHDPQGRHVAGWLKYQGRTYQ